MRNTADMAQSWVSQGRSGVVARAVEGEGLGPRAVDELVLLDREGHPSGSLLGGVLDQQLAGHARGLAGGDEPMRMVHLSVSPGDASAAGLTCGGSVWVLIQPLARIPAELWAALAGRRPVALVTAVGSDEGPLVVEAAGPGWGTLGAPGLDQAAAAEARATLARPGMNRRRTRLGDVQLVIETWSPKPRVLVAGVTELSEAIARQAELLGWQAEATTSGDCLPRLEGLGVSDAVVALDHDHGAATAVLLGALRGGVGYVGALGSRRTQAARREHLVAAGATPAELERLHGPTGLDLGARTPAETAVSIVAEILAVRSGRSAAALRQGEGSIKA